MAVDHYIDVRAYSLSHRFDRCCCGIDRFVPLKRHRWWYRHRLECREPTADRLCRQLAKSAGIVGRCFIEVFHTSTAEMAVKAHVIANRSAPKTVTRDAVNFSEKIPQRDIDSRNSRRTYDARSMPEMLPKHRLPQMFNPNRVLANQ